MNRRLPPLAPLVAFDAVARHRSFTRAATELGVTQSAISHQLRRLEQFFGVKLLRRLNPGIELSDHGAKLQAELSGVLDRLAGLEPRFRSPLSRPLIRITASSVLAAWWLVARLQSFGAKYPDIDIDFRPVQTETRSSDFENDVSILWAVPDEARAAPCQAMLIRESIFPVCAPSLLPNGKPLINPADLARLPLIQKGHAPLAEWGWPYWFERLGLQGAEQRGLILADVGLCLNAALNGDGVAIGRSLLVSDKMRDGALVPALADAPKVISPKVLIVRWSPARKDDRNIRTLVTWLTRAAEQTGH